MSGCRSSRGRSRCPRRGDPAVGDDRALPVRRARSGARRRRGPVVGRVDEDARRSTGRRAGRRRRTGLVPAGVVRPRLRAAARPRASRPPCRAEVATNTQVPFQIAGAENRSVGPGTGTVCSSPPACASAPAGARAGAAAASPSLPPCTKKPPASSAGAVEPRSRSVAFSSLLVRRRPVPEQPLARPARGRARCRPSSSCRRTARCRWRRGGRRSPGSTTGADAAPDRRVARVAGRRLDQLVAVGAERVPDARRCCPVDGFSVTTWPW